MYYTITERPLNQKEHLYPNTINNEDFDNILENIRKTEYKDYPSRKLMIKLFPNIDVNFILNGKDM